MISPELYYKKYLEGKTKEEILTAIRGLKQKMGYLKNIMDGLNVTTIVVHSRHLTIELQKRIGLLS